MVGSRIFFLGALLFLSASACNGNDAAPLPPGAIQQRAEQLRWQPGPPALPPGVRLVVLEGDPKKEALFTMRLKVPAGTRLPPHTHPRDERVTVLSGRVGVGFGREFAEQALRYFDAGGYYVNPAGVAHFVVFAQESVVQITTLGPWSMQPVTPKAE